MKTNDQIITAQNKIAELLDDTKLTAEQYANLKGIILGMAWCRGGMATTVDRLLAGEKPTQRSRKP